MNSSVSHWNGDLLGRRQDAIFVYNFLLGQVERRRTTGRPGSYVLNVDADWGGGKSFFLKGLAEDLECRGHVVVSVNAWRDDHAQDPYVALMAAIDRAFAPLIRKPGALRTAWSKAKSSGGAIALRMTGEVTKGLLKKVTGVSIDRLGEIASDKTLDETAMETAVDAAGKSVNEQLERLFDSGLEALIEGFQKTDDAISNFKDRMAGVINAVSDTRPAPVFIVVDELDRCRPTYAVQLLERVKHLFDVDGVVFVFATNADQLQHSIAGAYGSNFDGFRYLRRFFDRTYVFADPSIAQLVASLCQDLPNGKIKAPEGNVEEAIRTGCEAWNFDLRAIKQIVDLIHSTAVAWPHNIPIDISLLFPLCAYFYMTGKVRWPERQDLPQLEKWIMVRVPSRSFDGRARDRSYYFARIYEHARSVMGSLMEVMNDQRDAEGDASAQYTSSIFDAEWNGQRVDPSKPSIQTGLLEMVANAGRVISIDGEN